MRPAKGNQLQLARPVEDFLRHVEFAPDAGFVSRLFPLGREKPIVIDPEVSFGIPQVRGIRTELILDSLEAGETAAEAARSWGLSSSEVEAAAAWERELRAAA